MLASLWSLGQLRTLHLLEALHVPEEVLEGRIGTWVVQQSEIHLIVDSLAVRLRFGVLGPEWSIFSLGGCRLTYWACLNLKSA
jgi:hypothetical protein